MKIAFAAVIAASVALVTSVAEARQKTAEVVPNNKSCFDIDYVPALYSVNTRGKLVRKQSVERVYAIVEQVGGKAVDTRQPAIYLETRKLLEPDHYTMRSAACR